MKTKLMVYGCDSDERAVFLKYAEKYQLRLRMVKEPVSLENVRLAKGCSCVSVSHKARLTRELLKKLKEAGVSYISTRSIGVNHIDMEAAKEFDIDIGNSAYSPDSVADYTVMMILMALRNAYAIGRRCERYDFRLEEERGKELRDVTVGIIGDGHIGRAVTKRLSGFGCNVITYDACKSSVSLETLLEVSDVISLHIPLYSGTYHFIDQKEIDHMKDGAIIVNTGRGGLIHTAALIEALKTNKLSFAALDVIEGEDDFYYRDCSGELLPHKELLELLSMEQAFITPHTAFYTEHALWDSVKNSIKNCLEYERREKVC